MATERRGARPNSSLDTFRVTGKGCRVSHYRSGPPSGIPLACMRLNVESIWIYRLLGIAEKPRQSRRRGVLPHRRHLEVMLRW